MRIYSTFDYTYLSIAKHKADMLETHQCADILNKSAENNIYNSQTILKVLC